MKWDVGIEEDLKVHNKAAYRFFASQARGVATLFGRDLAIVSIGGEVVADYSVRLKKELDHRRVWINAYANDVPCYIPSERVLKEGGYEGGGAMRYTTLPGPFAPSVEQRILATVEQLVGQTRE